MRSFGGKSLADSDRSLAASDFAISRTMIGTARKQGWEVIHSLLRVPRHLVADLSSAWAATSYLGSNVAANPDAAADRVAPPSPGSRSACCTRHFAVACRPAEGASGQVIDSALPLAEVLIRPGSVALRRDTERDRRLPVRPCLE